jgi:hypothetical protein
MAKKTKKAPQGNLTSQTPNPFAPAYAARLARQVTQEFTSARPVRKKKTRGVVK